MDLGLGNRTTLKSFLLAESLRSKTSYDVEIDAIGKGVAAAMEQFCNRKFKRTVDDVFEINADRLSLIVQRYPIEVVTKIEIRDDLSTGWVDQGAVNNVLFNLREAAGMLQFAGYLGASFSRLRVTYTGGFWYETLEPTDVGYPTAQPAGSTALDASLKLAWLQQCAEVWSKKDKLGRNIVESAEAVATVVPAKFTEGVREILNSFVRYQMT